MAVHCICVSQSLTRACQLDQELSSLRCRYDFSWLQVEEPAQRLGLARGQVYACRRAHRLKETCYVLHVS